MKRLFILALTALLLMSVLVAPVSAAETEDPCYLELLDYGYSVESGTNSQAFGGGSVLTFTYNLPNRTTIQYVDVLFTYFKNDTPSVKWFSGDTVKGDLAVVNVNGNVYRAFGSVSAFYTGAVTLQITAGYANSNRITIESLKVGRDTYSQAEIEAYCEISAADYSNTIHYVPTDESNKRNFTGTTDYSDASYNLFIYTNEWRRFDYIDFMVYTSVDSTDSISCTIGGVSVPFEVSYLNNDSMTIGTFVYTVRMDLTGVDRSVNDYPMITVTGNVSTGQLNLISMLGCVGLVNVSAVDSDVFWFSKMVNYLDSIGDQLLLGFGGLGDLLSDIALYNDTIINRIETTGTDILTPGFMNLQGGIQLQTQAFEEYIASLSSDLQSKLDDVRTRIVTSVSNMSSAVTTKLDDVRSKIVTSVDNMSSAVTTKLDDVRSKIVTSVNNMKTAVTNKLDEVIAAIHGDTTSGDEFKEELTEQEQDLQDMQQVMDSVTKPNLTDTDISVDSYIDSNALSSFSSIFQILLTGSLFGPMVIMSILMATVSYAFFGKR